MRNELERERSRPHLLLDTLIKRGTSVDALLDEGVKKRNIEQLIRKEVGTFSTEELTSLTRMLINGMSREDSLWTQDRRDAAVEILRLVPLQSIDEKTILNAYLHAVKRQDPTSGYDPQRPIHIDPFGTVLSLLEAGKIIAPYIRQEKDYLITQAWFRVAYHFFPDDKEYVLREKDEIIANLNQVKRITSEEKTKLGWREKPKFVSVDDQEMHDMYFESLTRRPTFKIELWEHSPEFRERCKHYGIDLERFWNLSNPDEVLAASKEIQGRIKGENKSMFDRYLQKLVNSTIDELTDEQIRVVSDEIILAAAATVEELQRSIQDASATLESFQKLVNRAQDLPTRAKRIILKPVLSFFTNELGITLENDVAQLYTILHDKNVLERAHDYITNKQIQKHETITLLKELYQLNQKNFHYSLLSRNRDDMFLGDLTGDCTAYHLKIGINAWTVPIWLSNPGFNMFKVDEARVSKAGMILAIEGDNPVLVVDSFEVGEEKKHEEKTAQIIIESFSALQNWAQGIGIKKVYINTISNSSDAINLLAALSTEEGTQTKIKVLGGLSGVAEVRKNLLGKNTTEKIYIQSVEEPEIERPLSNEDAIKLSKFEEMVNEILSRLPDERKNIAESYTRTANWEGMLQEFINDSPILKIIVGNNLKQYQEIIDSGNFDYDVSFLIDKCANALQINIWDNDTNFDDLANKIIDQCGNLRMLAQLIGEMPWRPEEALKRLYMPISEKNNDLILSSGLRKITE